MDVMKKTVDTGHVEALLWLAQYMKSVALRFRRGSRTKAESHPF